jgi:hypothetical protein
VADALVSHVHISREAFSVHRYLPEDFLVVFASTEVKDRVAALPSVVHVHFSLFFRHWNRLAQAQKVAAQSKVHLFIEGIPSHAWDRTTIDHLLGTSCSLNEMAPETASREDLGMFKTMAWAKEVDKIPTARLLWVPKPAEGVELLGPQPTRHLHELGMLEYRVLIHVARVDEFIVMEGPVWVNSPGSGQSGLPSPDHSDGGGGFWTSRNLSWRAGAQDQRG